MVDHRLVKNGTETMYANTAETVNRTVGIRSGLAHYIGAYMRYPMGDGEIKHLILQIGEILADFLDMLVLKIS